MASTVRRRRSFPMVAAAVALAGCTATTTAAPATSPPTTAARAQAPAAVDLAPLAPRAGYGIFDAADGRCTVLAGDGLRSPVPVASVFKLWVLAAVARSIDAGARTWDTPVAIRDALRSDPSGEVYHYADGRLVTVSRLAELMISVSDNTATDHLIDLVGRDAVADTVRSLAPDGAARTLPLLTTAEMARLKFVHRDVGAAYAALDHDEKVRLLADLPARAPFPWPADPTAIHRLDLRTPSFVDEIEWFASGRDICTTLSHLAALARRPGLEPLDAVLGRSPGLPPAQARAWTTAWFKGGSEPGVVALAYRLATDGVDRVVVVALSDPDAALAERADGQRRIEAILEAARN